MTRDYSVTTPVQSIRFSSPDVHSRLRQEAARQGVSASGLAEQLIDEGLRARRHRLIVFRDGPTGRRAAVVNGPDVWEVVGAVLGSDTAPAEREERTAEVLGLSVGLVRAAVAYYAEYTEEIDARIAANREEADRAMVQWERQRQLLAQ